MEHLAFISDMEKGLAEAMKNIFPYAEHRVCIRHLWKNIKKLFRCEESSKVRSLVWTAANVYTKHEFDGKIAELFHVSPQVHSYLMCLPYKWSKHNFSSHIRNHYNTNNMSESFNSWIVDARGHPAVDLIDMIRGMLMEQRAQRKLNSEGWSGELVPHAEEYIREITTRKEQFIIRHSSPTKAEVEGNHGRHEVEIDRRECSCCFWQITGLPCIHAVVVIGTKHHPLWHTYVVEHYYVTRYRTAYEDAISTLPGKDQWHIVDDGVEIGLPNYLRPRGRPQKRRLKSFLERQYKKASSTHKCSRCGLWGHHRSTCKNTLMQATTEIYHGEMATAYYSGDNGGGTTHYDIDAVRAKLPVRRERSHN